jgi:Zn-dependent protease with chaperone function
MARKSMIVAAVAGVLCAFLSGVFMMGVPANASMVGRIFGDRYYEDIKGKFIDVAVEKAAEAKQDSNKKGHRGLVQGDIVGTRLYDAVPLPTVEARAREIMDRLIAQWPGERPPQIKIVITADPFFGAESAASHTISIAQGVIQQVESEDEFAAIIGHELGHVLLNHFARGAAHEREIKMIAHLSSTAVMAVAVSGLRVQGGPRGATVTAAADTGDKMRDALLIGFAIDRLAAIFNADWEREQEDEADLLGVDLLARAGYNVQAATDMLQRLRKTRDVNEEKVKRLKRFEDAAKAFVASGGNLDVLKSAGIAFLIDELISLLDDLLQSHPDPQRRLEDVGNYIAREYEDAQAAKKEEQYRALIADRRVASVLANHVVAADALGLLEVQPVNLQGIEEKARFATTGPTARAPYTLRALGQVLMLKGDGANAVSALSLAAQDPGASFITVTTLASAYARMRNFPAAHAELDRAAVRFGSAEAVMPARISVHLQEGDVKKADEVAQACRRVENSGIRKQCAEARKNSTCDRTSSLSQQMCDFGDGLPVGK